MANNLPINPPGSRDLHNHGNNPATEPDGVVKHFYYVLTRPDLSEVLGVFETMRAAIDHIEEINNGYAQPTTAQGSRERNYTCNERPYCIFRETIQEEKPRFSKMLKARFCEIVMALSQDFSKNYPDAPKGTIEHLLCLEIGKMFGTTIVPHFSTK